MAVVFTDVVDSLRLNEQLGDAAARRLWSEHDRRARELLQTWGGREIGRTDGFLILFDTVDAALGFALGYHAALATVDARFCARVGVHWGSVILRANSAADVHGGATPFEVDGRALPSAARVMSVAGGGQTLFSGAARQALSPAVAAGLRIGAHGHWRLQGLDELVELFEVAPADGALRPPHDAAKAYRVVLRDGQWVPAAALPHNLGGEPDFFVGREADLQRLARAFDGGSRLVTLLGIGGIGKTRLAQRYARGWLGSYPGGAWFCDLSAARGLDGIALAVAQALDVPLGRADPVLQLATVLAARGECLVILDNFEQVARHAEASAGVWLRQLPQVRFIVTSREVLGLQGETVQTLEPLDDAEAQALFRRRADAAGLGARLDEADEAALPRLVGLLDRLPLAIELAVARARVVPPAEQAERIGERFRLLAGRGGRHDRQATLRASLDWSWDLLGAHERSALAQLSVFEGGFTLDSAEAVLDLADFPQAPWAADVLQSLLEKSLVRRLHARRFDLLRSVQDYAAEQLAVLGTPAKQRHWRHFAALSEAQAIAERCVEIDNLAAACSRASAAAALAADGERRAVAACAVGALVNAWAALRLTGPFRVATRLAEPLSRLPDLAPLHCAQLERVLGGAAGLMGDGEAAGRHYRSGLALSRQAGQRALEAEMQCLLADLDVLAGRFDAAASALREADTIADAPGALRLLRENIHGNLALALADLGQAQARYGAALLLAESIGDRRWQGGLNGSLGTVAIMAGRLGQARLHLEQGLHLAHGTGDRQWAGTAHCNLGLVLYELQELVGAREHLQASLQLARDVGHRRLEATSLCNLGLVLRSAGVTDEALAQFEQAVQVARALQLPRMEGQFRGYLGEMLAAIGRGDAALACLDEAEALLLRSDDTAALALLACQRTQCLAKMGADATAVTASLDRAQALARKFDAGADSELGKALAAARRVVSRNC